jgi:cardiolipin synthase (CMP-forming)
MKKINLRKFTLKILKRLPDSERRITVPTLFTFARIAFVPIVVVMMIVGWWGYALLFFIAACATDVIDGLLARLLNEKTFLGACLDPIADKLLLTSCFFTLACISTPLFAMPQLFVLFVVSKEIIQIAGACFIYHVRGHLDVQPTFLSKMTTFIQMIFLMWLFASHFFCWAPIKTYYTMLGIMIVFIGASFVQYVRIGFGMLKQG